MGALTRRAPRRAALFLCALAVLAAACLTVIPVGVREEALGPAELARDPMGGALQARMDEIAAPFGEAAGGGAVYWGDVHVVRYRNLLGQDGAAVLVPYLTARVRDVGTAGSSDWSFRLEVLSCRYSGGTLSEGRAPWVRRAALSVEADQNTAFTGGVTGPQGVGGLLHTLRVELDRRHRLEAGGYLVEASVSTVDSAAAPCAACTACVRWDGALAVQLGPALFRTVGFALDTAVPYEGNVIGGPPGGALPQN